MTQRTKAVHTWAINVLNLAVLWGTVSLMPLVAQDAAHHHPDVPAQLVQDVRKATQQFLNVNNAGLAGYEAAFGCVTGPDHGAMGIHYVNMKLVGDGAIDKNAPEALIYEPVGNGRRLVGVEYIVDAATWLAAHDNAPPSLDGQDFQFVGSPNRFALDPFFELHVWAWRDNPQGAFVDWNNAVTCEKMKATE